MTERPTRRLSALGADGEAAIAAAAAILRGGGLVAFPTETVYGLGADALDPHAVAGIYEAKGRPAFNPVIVHLADAEAARGLAAEWPASAERLARAFWPGPLTIVVPRGPAIPDIVTAGSGGVGLRVPAHPVALALLRAAGVPLAAPSANRSNELSPTRAAHVLASLDGRIDAVLDGGACDVGIESTVVDCTGPRPVILRPGQLSREAIAAVAGPLGERGAAPEGEAPRPSPGMLERHYAPRASLAVLPRDALVTRLRAAAPPVGAVLLGDTPTLPRWEHVVVLPHDPARYAAALYDTLHGLDDAGVREILVELPPDEPAWEGIRDRLRRAGA